MPKCIKSDGNDYESVILVHFLCDNVSASFVGITYGSICFALKTSNNCFYCKYIENMGGAGGVSDL